MGLDLEPLTFHTSEAQARLLLQLARNKPVIRFHAGGRQGAVSEKKHMGAGLAPGKAVCDQPQPSIGLNKLRLLTTTTVHWTRLAPLAPYSSCRPSIRLKMNSFCR